MDREGAPKKENAVRRRAWQTAVVLLLLAFVIRERRWFVMNDITTGSTRAYPELQSHAYALDLAHTRVAAEAICRTIPRWHVVSAPAAPELHVEVHTALLDFIDDLTVRFEPLTVPVSSPTRVIIRSHSRVGKGDLGENARHIHALQAAMDARLPHATL